MKIDKANSRDKKLYRRRWMWGVSGRSVFLTQEILYKKAQEIKKNKKGA